MDVHEWVLYENGESVLEMTDIDFLVRDEQIDRLTRYVTKADHEAALAEERERSALAERVLDVGFYVDHYCEQCSRPIYDGEPRVLDEGGSFHCWRHSGDGKPNEQCVTNTTFAALIPTLGRRQQVDELRAERDALAKRVAELEAEIYDANKGARN